MVLTPQQILEEYKNKSIDEIAAADLLIHLIENTNQIDVCIESIGILKDIGYRSDKMYSYLENLLISESDKRIRKAAANTLKDLYQERTLSPLKWSLEHEKSWQFLIDIVNLISQINSDDARSILIDRIWKFEHHDFNIDLRKLFKSKEIQEYPNENLAEIINNYLVINEIDTLLKETKYQIEGGIVSELDLSFVTEQTNGWKILKNFPIFLTVLNKLKTLNLRSNKIVVLPATITSLAFLEYLDLSYNMITQLPKDMGSLKSLEYLNLKHNELNEIPNSIGDLNNLKLLNLKLNKLAYLPPSMENLHRLEVLNLHGNQFNEIPITIMSLKSLKKLNLGLNDLKIVPEWLQDLESLKILALGGNKELSNLGDWIIFLPRRIEELDLYDNDITALPKNINLLKSLRRLILPNNNLTSLPENFKELHELKLLDLSWNNLKNLPDWIDSFIALESLNLRGNKINSLPQSIFSLPNLRTLNLSLNKEIIHKPIILDLEKKGIKVIK
ncbi:MAG: hypothetical protein EU542_04410 [Promethearchaeota archaeon]|nr:MAG: hypothetical protein EU542_04410 [Candidatus Lokiarchaeota archaeon]